MQTICMEEQCLKNYLLIILNKKKTSGFDEKFVKNYDKNSDKRYVLEVLIVALMMVNTKRLIY